MVRLEKINGKNVWDVLELSVGEQQKKFVASNDISIIEAYVTIANGGHAFPFAIYDEDIAVGFLMIGFGAEENWENPPEIAHDNYSLWRLMIDEHFQRKGLGKAVLRIALDFIQTQPCGAAPYCWVSYAPENETARRLYASFGFWETGEMDGDEIIAVLKL